MKQLILLSALSLFASSVFAEPVTTVVCGGDKYTSRQAIDDLNLTIADSKGKISTSNFRTANDEVVVIVTEIKAVSGVSVVPAADNHVMACVTVSGEGTIQKF